MTETCQNCHPNSHQASYKFRVSCFFPLSAPLLGPCFCFCSSDYAVGDEMLLVPLAPDNLNARLRSCHLTHHRKPSISRCQWPASVDGGRSALKTSLVVCFFKQASPRLCRPEGSLRWHGFPCQAWYNPCSDFSRPIHTTGCGAAPLRLSLWLSDTNLGCTCCVACGKAFHSRRKHWVKSSL